MREELASEDAGANDTCNNAGEMRSPVHATHCQHVDDPLVRRVDYIYTTSWLQHSNFAVVQADLIILYFQLLPNLTINFWEIKVKGHVPKIFIS